MSEYLLRRGRMVLLVVTSLLAAPVAAGKLTVEGLLAALSVHRELHGGFVETRKSGLLTTELRSEGRLVFRAPAYLEKHVLEPVEQKQIIDGDRLVLERPGQKRRELSLASVPELEMVIISMRSTLAGDLQGLQRYYRVSLTGDEQDWTLRLLPKSQELADVLRYIDISGAGNEVREFRVVQNGGDESRTVIRRDDNRR